MKCSLNRYICCKCIHFTCIHFTCIHLVAIDECSKTTCNGHGTCRGSIEAPTCSCFPHYLGNDCEKGERKCMNRPLNCSQGPHMRNWGHVTEATRLLDCKFSACIRNFGRVKREITLVSSVCSVCIIFPEATLTGQHQF